MIKSPALKVLINPESYLPDFKRLTGATGNGTYRMEGHIFLVSPLQKRVFDNSTKTVPVNPQ